MSSDGVEEFWSALRFFEEHGEHPAGVAGEGEVACRECGGSAASLPGHLGSAHGLSVGEYASRYGYAPLSGPEPEPPGMESFR